eukprot:3868915-Pleurochrysis_carterae.AAC.1
MAAKSSLSSSMRTVEAAGCPASDSPASSLSHDIVLRTPGMGQQLVPPEPSESLNHLNEPRLAFVAWGK